MNDIRLHGAALYNPVLSSREELKDYFVARTELLDRIVAGIRQEQPGGPCRHRLILGLRGMGKSTLLRRIGIAVEEDAELGKLWLPLTFPEEQYNISKPADLWRNCLDAFCDLLEERGRKDETEALDKVVDEVEDALALLLAEADKLGCRLLLLMDNMDLILERLKGEQEQLRMIFQRESRLLLIGASTQPVEADFFHTADELKGLSVEEMRATLRKLAELGKTPQVAQLLDDDPARIKTLHTLTGGNPRTIVLLYNVLSRGLDGDVRSDLEGLLDLVTPLYKARFEELPAQAQQLVDGLAVNWDPMTARQLADRLGWEVNTASAQLNRLQQQGVVEKVEPAKGGRAAFQIGERFFNIWYLMRASRRVRRKLIWLVHFLRMFFTAAELQGHAKKLLREEKNDVRWGESILAFAQAVEDRRLKKELNLVGLRCLLKNERDWKKVEGMFDIEGEDAEIRPLLRNIIRDLEVNKAIRLAIKEGIMSSYDDVDGAERAVELYKKPEIAAHVWNSWLFFNFRNTKPFPEQQVQKAEAAYRKAIHADTDNAKVWKYLGILLDKLKRFDEAEDSYKKSVEIEPDSADIWYYFAGFLKSRELLDEAEQAYKKALEIEPNYAWLWDRLGQVLMQLKRFDEAEKAYREAVKLKPDDAWFWSGLANFLKERGRIDEAEQACREVVKLEPDEAWLWYNIAKILKDQGHFDEAEQAYRKAVEIAPDNTFYSSCLANFLEESFAKAYSIASLMVEREQWPEAETHFRALLTENDDEFFEEHWQDMLTLFKEAIRTGKAAEALRLLDESPLAERWRPLREALAAAAEDSSRYLNGVAPEVRQPALEILKTIAPDMLASRIPYELQGNA
jgi:tetratricopeptide (TPR) repeat protein